MKLRISERWSENGTVPKDQKNGITAYSNSCAIPGVTLNTIRVHSIETLISREGKKVKRTELFALSFHIKIVPKLLVFYRQDWIVM